MYSTIMSLSASAAAAGSAQLSCLRQWFHVCSPLFVAAVGAVRPTQVAFMAAAAKECMAASSAITFAVGFPAPCPARTCSAHPERSGAIVALGINFVENFCSLQTDARTDHPLGDASRAGYLLQLSMT